MHAKESLSRASQTHGMVFGLLSHTRKYAWMASLLFPAWYLTLCIKYERLVATSGVPRVRRGSMQSCASVMAYPLTALDGSPTGVGCRISECIDATTCTNYIWSPFQ